MGLQLALKGLELTRKKNWVILLAAFGLTSYGFYRAHHFPATAQKRKRVLKLLGALISMAEAVSDCSETVGVVSKDLKHFLQSESDQIPNSLKQASKITMSNEFSQSITGITQALTVGIVRGYQSEARSGNGLNAKPTSMDQVMDKLFSKAGAGFASVVVGRFARNLVLALMSSGAQSEEALTSNPNSLETNPVPTFLNVVSSDKFRELIGDCIQLSVTSMISVYLEKTKHVNTYDEFFAGLTNPKHETQVREVLVTVCNGAIETMVKASHQVLTSSTKSFPSVAIEYKQDATGMNELSKPDLSLANFRGNNSFDEVKNDGWVGKVSSTLATPSNRRFILDVTGRVTFETVRSFLEFLLQMLHEGTKKCVNFAHEAVVEGGVEAVKYVRAKSSAVSTVCLSLCLHILGSVWIFVPA